MATDTWVDNSDVSAPTHVTPAIIGISFHLGSSLLLTLIINHNLGHVVLLFDTCFNTCFVTTL